MLRQERDLYRHLSELVDSRVSAREPQNNIIIVRRVELQARDGAREARVERGELLELLGGIGAFDIDFRGIVKFGVLYLPLE